MNLTYSMLLRAYEERQNAMYINTSKAIYYTC